MRLAGTIARLQVQRSSLKLGERPRRWYDPAPLTPVVALELEAGGVVGIAEDGERIVDVHHRRHPESRYGNANGLSLGFTSHYARMRQRFGERIVDGIAGENVLVRTEEEFFHEDLPAALIVETSTGPAKLVGARVIEPCVEFSRYALELVGPPGHDLPTPVEHYADGASAGDAPAPGRPDPRVKETLVFLRRGLRGYCATYAGGPTVLRVGDRLLLP
jgi:hypothetical protein